MTQLYTDLLDDKSFRLATVSLGTLPDTRAEVPSVKLATHPLGSKVPYSALSYTWGPPQNLQDDYESSASILFNEQVFEIHSNLYHALLELQAACPNTFIWIDALCINQFNAKERSIQVSVMNKIYGNANCVIVWLGKAFPDLITGIEAARRIGTDSVPHTLRMLRTQSLDSSNDLSNMSERYGMRPISKEEAIGLATLFSCNFFVRIWVIQEVSLTDNVVILCNGDFTPFDIIVFTAAFLHCSCLYQHVYALVPATKGGAHVLNDINIFEAERIGVFRHWYQGKKSQWAEALKVFDCEAGIGETQPKSSEMMLLSFLVMSFKFRSSDPRDIIYGLCGIVKQMAAKDGVSFPPEFEPDYDIDVNDLFTAISRKIIETTDSLVYLGLVKNPTLRKTPGLPSWVPDFSPADVNSLSGANFRSMGTLNASKYTPHTSTQQTFSVDEKTLNVSGFCLGKIDKLGNVFMDVKRGQQKANADILLSMEQVYPYTGQSSDEAFWRTLIWDTDLSYRPAKHIRLGDFQMATMQFFVRALSISHREASSLEEGQDLVLQSIKRMSYLERISTKFPSSIFPSVNLIKSMCMTLDLVPKEEVILNEEEKQMLLAPKAAHSVPPGWVVTTTYAGHKPFLTRNGYLGMGFESIEVGDEVWIVRGCPTPLVLRREEERFSLVGESYVHGVMKGEAVDDDTRWEKIQII